MRMLPLIRATLVALFVAVLLAPAALAAGPTASTNRFFVITGLVLGDQKADASGKLAIANGQLSASVGCNSIGGKASLDGDTLTVADGLTTTLIGCPEAQGRLEDMLLKILGHGPFHITATAWIGDGASIQVSEIPMVAPAPGGGAPDQPIGSSPGIVIVPPPVNCPETNGGGATGSGGSSASGGSGSSGSSVGSSGSGSAPSATAVAVPDGPTSTSAAGSGGGVTDPAPPPNGVAVPPGPPEPAASGATDPDPGFTGGGTPGQPGIGTDPRVGKPLDPCLAGTYQIGEPQGGAAVAPKAADTAEHASIASSAGDSWLPIAAGLAVLATFLVAGLLGARRWRARAAVSRLAPAEVPPADSPEGPASTPR